MAQRGLDDLVVQRNPAPTAVGTDFEPVMAC